MGDSEDRRDTRRLVLALVVVLAAVAVGVGVLVRSRGPGTTPPAAAPASPTPVASGSGVRLTVIVPTGTSTTVSDRVIDVLSTRLRGVTGTAVTRSGQRITVSLAPSSDQQAVLNLVQDPGTFEIRPVLVTPTTTVTPSAVDDPGQPVVLAGLGAGSGSAYALGPAVLTGTAIASASAQAGEGGPWQVEVQFTAAASAVWAHFTGQLACAAGTGRQLAIVVDGEVASAPMIDTDVACRAGITAGATLLAGAFTQAQAQELATVLTSGPLPVPISVVAGSP